VAKVALQRPLTCVWEVPLLTCGRSVGRAGNHVVSTFREHPTDEPRGVLITEGP
jgi:hypothetical protein